jgi:hypothetical protein
MTPRVLLDIGTAPAVSVRSVACPSVGLSPRPSLGDRANSSCAVAVGGINHPPKATAGTTETTSRARSVATTATATVDRQEGKEMESDREGLDWTHGRRRCIALTSWGHTTNLAGRLPSSTASSNQCPGRRRPRRERISATE